LKNIGTAMKYKEKSQLHLDCKDAKVKAFQVRW